MNALTFILGMTNADPSVTILPVQKPLANFPEYIDSTIPAPRSSIEPASVMTQSVTWENSGSNEEPAIWDVEKASSPEEAQKLKASNQLAEMILKTKDMLKDLSLAGSLIRLELIQLFEVHKLVADMNEIFVQMEKMIRQKAPSEEEMPDLVEDL